MKNTRHTGIQHHNTHRPRQENEMNYAIKRTRQFYEGGGKCYKCTVYYRDDDNSSGLGDNPQVAYWYGKYEDAPREPPSHQWISLAN